MPKIPQVKDMNEFVLMFNNQVLGKGVSLTDNYDRGVQDIDELGNFYVQETIATKFSGTLTMTALELSVAAGGVLEQLAVVPDGFDDVDMRFADINIIEINKTTLEEVTTWIGCDMTGGSVTRAPHAIVGRNVTWRYKRRLTKGKVVV